MWELMQKGGIVMYPLLFCSILAMGVVLERFWSFRLLLAEGRRIGETEPEQTRRERAWEAVVRRMERGLGILETIITVAPMLGLLGTILGLIVTFDVLGAGADQFSKAQLSSGLAEAMLTTAFGLFIAIPALVAYNGFRRRIDLFIDWCNERLADGTDRAC